MHIDHSKFIELLAEASGIEADKVEEHLQELTDEIMQAVSEQEAYEIEGFGIFSGIGNRVLFIPAKELETEINYKYVGMEPIELDDDEIDGMSEEDDDEGNPFEGLQMEEDDDDKRNPFAGLVEGYEEMEEQMEQEDADAEDEEDEEDEIATSNNETAEEEDDDDDEDDAILDDIVFGVEGIQEDKVVGKVFKPEADESEEKESDEDTEEVSEDEEEHIKPPGADEWGIDAHKDNKGPGRLFSSLMGEESDEDDDQDADENTLEGFDEDIFENDDEEEENKESLNAELSDLMSDEAGTKTSEELENEDSDPFAGMDDDEDDEDESESSFELDTEADEEDEEDFDDPFAEFEDDEDEDEIDLDDEVIPVITNTSSDVNDPMTDATEPEKKTKPKGDQKQVSPVLISLVIIVIIAAGVVGLAFFGVINIPGISPQTNTNPPVTQTIPTPTPVPEKAPTESEAATTESEEQAPSEQVPVNTAEAGDVPAEQSKYGMTGVASNAANDGYTIVIYSLRNRENALNQQSQLKSEGYRALVTPIPSAQYGTLYRVSLGQFASLYDAAVAADDLKAPYNQNYFIKQIIN